MFLEDSNWYVPTYYT